MEQVEQAVRLVQAEQPVGHASQVRVTLLPQVGLGHVATQEVELAI